MAAGQVLKNSSKASIQTRLVKDEDAEMSSWCTHEYDLV